jgi:hypothetical protein
MKRDHLLKIVSELNHSELVYLLGAVGDELRGRGYAAAAVTVELAVGRVHDRAGTRDKPTGE